MRQGLLCQDRWGAVAGGLAGVLWEKGSPSALGASPLHRDADEGEGAGVGEGCPAPPHWRGPRDKSHIPTWGREEGRVPGLVTPTDSSPEARGPEILESPPPLLCKFLYKELEGV